MERYSKIKLIGSGTFGQAWLVQSVMSLRNYALKELGVTSMSDQDRHLALNEAKILSKLKHKNIVRYKEAFVAEGKLCIAMEFAEQGDLYTRIKERNGTYFPEMQILDWFTQLCLALKYIHGQNILHRDLKTQNIFLSKNDVIKLGDFGIARMLNSTLDHAQTTVGTPYYLSPEMCQRKPYNHKSDMWSLGCVLYEMATLKHAFHANNFSALVIKILQGQYPPIPRVYGALLEDLVSVLLQKDPEDRPSAKQILYVPAMQSYVKKFLLGERERVDSMASDVYDVSGKCPSSCVIDSKEVGRPQRNSSADVEAPRDKSLEDENRCGENTLKSHEHSRVTNSKLRNIPAQNTTERPCNNICAPSHALNEMEQDSTCKIKATKPRKTIIASENLLKLRARLRSRFSVGTAHAQERRYSEQNLVCAGACGSVCKERILSHGGQLEEITHAEDDVFVKNQVTVIPSRIPNSKYVTQRGDSTTKTLKENRSRLDKRIPEAVTRRRQKPAMSVCQPKCNEGIPIKKRHQSELAAFVERDRCPKQRSQQLQRQVEVNFTDQPKVNDKENIEPFSRNAKVTAKRRASYTALKQIQTSILQKQKARNTENHDDGKGTYTVLRGCKFSKYQIPEVEPKSHYNEECHGSEDKIREDNIKRGDFETVNESTSLLGRDGGRIASVNKEDCKNCRAESAIHSHLSEFTSKISRHRETEATCQKRLYTPSKFTFCGKTLHLEDVSSNDSVFSHIEALRMHLERKLGTRLLAAVYRYVTNSSLEKDDERVRRTVECILGEQNMVYFPVLLQLVACDAMYFH